MGQAFSFLAAEFSVDCFVWNVIVDSENILFPFYIFRPVAFEPFYFAVVFKCENVGTDSVQEVSVVADYKYNSSKRIYCFFQ